MFFTSLTKNSENIKKLIFFIEDLSNDVHIFSPSAYREHIFKNKSVFHIKFIRPNVKK